MDERTWQLFTKAACSRDRRVRGQVFSQRDFGSRTQPFERFDVDDGHCSCHPAEDAAPAQTSA